MIRLFQVAALLAIAAALSACGGLFAKSQERLPYRFFRIEADFEVKATGEKIRFDYVAWCGGSVTHWRAGSPSIRYNLYPEMMHQPTADGAAIGIRSFNMCDEWTWEPDRDGKSRIPDDLLPVVQWYPDVNDMSFAIGYESDAAYESPFSKLTFLGASLTQTDAEAWNAWRKPYEAAFKPVGDIESPYYDYNTPSKIQLGCNRASRAVIPPERMAEAERFVPAGTGRFWSDAVAGRTEVNKQSSQAFGDLLASDTWSRGENFGGHKLYAYERSGIWLGAMTRSGGGRVRFKGGEGPYTAYSDMFPVFLSLADAPDKPNGVQGMIDLHVPTSNDWNGFSVCGDKFIPQETLEAYSRGDLPKEALDLPSIKDFNWHDDANPETEDGIVRSQTAFRKFIGGQLVTDKALQWERQGWVYDREGFMYIFTVD